MFQERVHTIYVDVNREVSDLLFSAYGEITKQYKDKRGYDWKPHMNILSAVIKNDKTEQFTKQFMGEFKNNKKTEIVFTHFSMRESGYIFLEPDLPSKKLFKGLHSRALRHAKKLGYEGYTIGRVHQYPFNPHLSVIKLDPEKISKAFDAVKNRKFEIKMPVNEYILGRQVRKKNGLDNFKTLGTIKLQ